MPDLIHSIRIAASPDAVYRLVSTAAGFAEWWAADVTGKDGLVDLGFFHRQTVYRLRMQNSDPPHRAEWLCETGQEWATTHLVFQLEPAGGGTLLRFAHAGWSSPTDYFVSCNTTWGGLMFRLRAAAEGKSPGPLFPPEGLAY
ncbi:MAG: SRPBCC domain-containing protein [Acidobacteriia bacterium]|nr:SRPBCC domain-containing protein [Terriglobia bacterium]